MYLTFVLSLTVLVTSGGSVAIRDLEAYEGELDAFLDELYRDYGPLFSEDRFDAHAGHESATHYLNEWVVYVPEGSQKANELANETGYDNVGSLRGFPLVFRMKNPKHPNGHTRNARALTQQLTADRRVRWADQLFVKERQKRDLSWNSILRDLKLGSILHEQPILNSEESRFNDELWDKEWYLFDTRTRNTLPRLDLNVLPVFDEGITGKGINVLILDDGIEHTHEDLRNNYNADISYDLNGNKADPMPSYGATPPNSHGTRCAGEVVMRPNNTKCGVGIAYGARIGGIRMLDGPVSDQIEGEALSYALDKVDVFSASWGPNDNGEVVEGPGRIAQMAFLKGVTKGRKGKGSIYVWASGNGGAKGDSCSCDGYASSIYTLSIGSASESGSFPWYGEKCPSTMAVTYSSGAYTDQKIATTDINNECTTGHTGTSASAPLAAGIVALALEVNPTLTWRDIQHLVVWTSEPSPLKDNPGWISNGAGFEFSTRFGFGLMNSHAMVTEARKWKNVPEQRICQVRCIVPENKSLDPKGIKLIHFETGDECWRSPSSEVNYLEHVEVITTIHYSRRGALHIQLTSPQGTAVNLLIPRKNDVSSAGFNAWPFMSVSTWGEKPKGNWTMTIADITKDGSNEGSFVNATLILYGTTLPPQRLAAGRRVYSEVYRKKSYVPKSSENSPENLQKSTQNLQEQRLEKLLQNLESHFPQLQN